MLVKPETLDELEVNANKDITCCIIFLECVFFHSKLTGMFIRFQPVKLRNFLLFTGIKRYLDFVVSWINILFYLCASFKSCEMIFKALLL